MTLERIKKYLADNFEEGDTIGSWDGGNDSGWENLELIEDSAVQDAVYQLVHDELAYGSYAGNFSTTGTITFEGGSIKCTGDEYDEENLIHVKTVLFDYPIKEEIARQIDSYSVYGVYWDIDKRFQFNLKNGILTEEMSNLEDIILDKFKEFFDRLTDEYDSDDGYRIYLDIVTELEDNSVKFEMEIEKERHTEIEKIIPLC